MNKPEAKEYVKGINKYLDAANTENATVWIINGTKGRIPIIAETEAEAQIIYAEK